MNSDRHSILRDQFTSGIETETAIARIPDSIRRLYRKETLAVNRNVQIIARGHDVTRRKIDARSDIKTCFILQNVPKVALETRRIPRWRDCL